MCQCVYQVHVSCLLDQILFFNSVVNLHTKGTLLIRIIVCALSTFSLPGILAVKKSDVSYDYGN